MDTKKLIKLDKTIHEFAHALLLWGHAPEFPDGLLSEPISLYIEKRPRRWRTLHETRTCALTARALEAVGAIEEGDDYCWEDARDFALRADGADEEECLALYGRAYEHFGREGDRRVKAILDML